MPKSPINVTAIIEVEMPSLPNFLKTNERGSIDVADVDETTLRKIGRAWTAALVVHARLRRVGRGKRP